MRHEQLQQWDGIKWTNLNATTMEWKNHFKTLHKCHDCEGLEGHWLFQPEKCVCKVGRLAM